MLMNMCRIVLSVNNVTVSLCLLHVRFNASMFYLFCEMIIKVTLNSLPINGTWVLGIVLAKYVHVLSLPLVDSTTHRICINNTLIHIDN